MAADLTLLDPQFQALLQQMLSQCAAQGVTMVPNEGLRDPFKQGIYWRQSRSTQEINAKIQEFKNKGASFLAHCIESVGPQHGDHVTNTPPGISWHQWGLAADFFWLVNGKAEWSTKVKVNGVNGYHVMAAVARGLGLNPGLLWTSFRDPPHVQMPKQNNAASVHSLQEIDATMKARFGP
ncbi:MAG TPA: M15 family metallopeptidase [Prosthecobacter sp.]